VDSRPEQADKGRAISVYARLPIFHACVNVFGSPTRDLGRCKRRKTDSFLPVALFASSGEFNADPNRNTANQCQNHQQATQQDVNHHNLQNGILALLHASNVPASKFGRQAGVRWTDARAFSHDEQPRGQINRDETHLEPNLDAIWDFRYE